LIIGIFSLVGLLLGFTGRIAETQNLLSSDLQYRKTYSHNLDASRFSNHFSESGIITITAIDIMIGMPMKTSIPTVLVLTIISTETLGSIPHTIVVSVRGHLSKT
jgi:phage-related protein